jgi:hypothetical protein
MSIDALSAIDGRYETSVASLKEYLSEVALIRARVTVEVEWLIHLASEPSLPTIRGMHADEIAGLAGSDGIEQQHTRRRREGSGLGRNWLWLSPVFDGSCLVQEG